VSVPRSTVTLMSSAALPASTDPCAATSAAGSSSHATRLATAMLARLDTEHPALAGHPDRDQLLAAAWLATHRSTRTRRAYANDLAAWPHWLREVDVDVLAVRRIHVDLWVRLLLDAGAAAASVNRHLSALTSWYHHLIEHDRACLRGWLPTPSRDAPTTRAQQFPGYRLTIESPSRGTVVEVCSAPFTDSSLEDTEKIAVVTLGSGARRSHWPGASRSSTCRTTAASFSSARA
jgi:Phage integrase, N-terminal SAM-like domain